MRIGCDLVDLARFRKIIENQNFLHRVFHPLEIAECQKRHNPASSYAARFAVKEAFVKALGTGLLTRGVAPLDIWVRKDEQGRPYVEYASHVETLLQTLGHAHVDISMSHDGDYALATVLLF